jgi:glucosylceramidase
MPEEPNVQLQAAQSGRELDRRSFIAAAGALTAGLWTRPASARAQAGRAGARGASLTAPVPATWLSTTREHPWREIRSGLERIELTGIADLHVMLRPDESFQTIEGFGGCLHEKGWQAMSALKPQDRERVMHELFAPGAGANLGVCRIPIGANDYALDWYSHDETPGDFTMSKFSIARDEKLIVPFLKAVQAVRPDLVLWASPWSPPTWMKTNGHYACSRPRMGAPDNGLREDQVRREGEDTFIQQERYFRAYALYFRRFVEEYRKLGLPVAMVMPQNEFNSAQVFPSCTWTPAGLARFIPYLGEALAGTGTAIFFGTLERPDPMLFEKVYSDPKVRPLVKGIGAQWAGRQAIPFIHNAHPELAVYQSEQECGNGLNDWRFARFTWTMMKDFMRAGASVYDYWNVATEKGGVSTWGWPQNSMISVDLQTGEYTTNPDYYVFKHLSHYVKRGARRIRTLSYAGYENLLAFRNPDGAIVVVVQNDMAEPAPLHLTIGRDTLAALLPGDSFNTIVI